MKVGILTFANVANFGANLQALSTVSYFRSRGHEALVIDWSPLDFRLKFQNGKDIQSLEHYCFFHSMIPHTAQCTTDEDIAYLLDSEKFDAVIIGSDAVLQDFPFFSRFHFPTSTIYRIDPITSDRIFPNAFWGSFYPLLKRKIPLILMSGSCQNSSYLNILLPEMLHMKRQLKSFAYFSVRDKWTRNMIRYVSLGEKVPLITPDPVFAFNQNYPQSMTKKMILDKYDLPDRYVLFSFKDPRNIQYSWLESIQRLFVNAGFECVAFPMPNGTVFKHPFRLEINTPLNPLDWYNIIKFSSAYIGENMHPIVVSLHNVVPFFSFDAYGKKIFRKFFIEKSSKVYDILDTFGFTEQRISIGKRITPEEVFYKILRFDKEKCRTKSDLMLQRYNQMMDEIIKAIKA